MEVIKAPEILNPFRIKTKRSRTDSLYPDLRIDVLIELAGLKFERPQHSRYSDKFPLENLAERVFDQQPSIETANYRLDVLDDLINNDELFEEAVRLEEAFQEYQKASKIYENGDYKEFSRERILPFFSAYLKIFENFEKLINSKCAGLRTIAEFLNQLKQSDHFRSFNNIFSIISQDYITMDLRVVIAPGRTSLKTLSLGGRKTEHVNSVLLEMLGSDVFYETPEGMSASGNRDAFKAKIGYEENADLARFISGYLFMNANSVIKANKSQVSQVESLHTALHYYTKWAGFFRELKSMGMDICRPEILPMEERRMELIDARNPEVAYDKKNPETVIANGLSYDPKSNVLVLNGPNNGGKTTYLRIPGMFALMASSGLYVVAKQARISITDGIYSHFESKDDPSIGEGTLLHERNQLYGSLKRLTPWSLGLFDEPYRGTDHRSSVELGVEAIDLLHRSGAAIILCTHIHEVAEHASSLQAVRNMHPGYSLDQSNIFFTYKIEPGFATGSYGALVAESRGTKRQEVEQELDSKAKAGGYEDLLR